MYERDNLAILMTVCHKHVKNALSSDANTQRVIVSEKRSVVAPLLPLKLLFGGWAFSSALRT